MRHRGPNNTFTLNRWGMIALAAGLCVSVFAILSTCRSDRVTVNPKDPRSPKYAYRMDELALLQMAADDVLNLEKKKQYGTIYDEYTSREFQKNVSRRRFLIMSNCVETYLGGLQEFDSNDLGFDRQLLPGQRRPLDVLTRRIQRERGAVDEQLVFIPTGFNFRLNGLYWISKDKIFMQCIADSPKIEANTAPMPAEPSPEQTEAGKAPGTEKPAEQASPDGNQPPVPTGTPSGQPASPPVQPTPVTEPGNNIPAHPAGAGGVMDNRPETEPEKPPTPAPPPSGDSNKQGHARGNRGVAMPLEPGGNDSTAYN